ncbi:GTP pyrophosphokinase [Actinomycetota bacterium]
MARNQAARIRRATERYAADRPQVEAATAAYVALVTQLLDDAGIDYLSVTGRTKSVESYAGKAARRIGGKLAFPDPATDITDQIGVRVVAYVLADVDAIAQLLGDQLTLLDDRDMGQETAAQGRFGYSSRHLLVALDPAREKVDGPMRGRRASVQVRTVLQHAWAEFEHDIRYKGTVPEEHASDLDRRFTLAAGLLELADQQFSTIRDRLRDEVTDTADEDDDDPRIAATDLAAFLAGQFADAGWSRTGHYEWIAGLLLELGITSLEELRELLRSVDQPAISTAMGYHYPPGAVRRLDDALLATYRDRYLALHGNAHRVDQLRGRLERLPRRA